MHLFPAPTTQQKLTINSKISVLYGRFQKIIPGELVDNFDLFTRHKRHDQPGLIMAFMP